MTHQTIGNLSAKELARHAFNVFLFAGRHQSGARLIYRALDLSPYDALALRCLSDLLDNDGTQIFSAIVLEYALADNSPISLNDRAELDYLRFFSQWSWGFAHHKSGETNLAQDAFVARSDFVLDEAAYAQFLSPILQINPSAEAGFQAAHRFCGVLAGFLAPIQDKAGLEGCFEPNNFQTTPAYELWLQESTAEFDALEKARQEQSSPIDPA